MSIPVSTELQSTTGPARGLDQIITRTKPEEETDPEFTAVLLLNNQWK